MTNQNDFVIDNGTGLAVRTDIQDALQALAGNSSGNLEPSVKYAYQWWADSNAGVMKLRNSANNDWIEMFQLDGTFTIEDGSNSAPGLAFRDNLNTGVYSSAADTFNVATGGVERMELGANTIFNEDGENVDFRIEGDTEANLFYLDASTNSIGIGTSAPNSGRLHVTHSSGTIGYFESTQTAANVANIVANSTDVNSSANLILQINSGTSAQGIIRLNGNNSIDFHNGASPTVKARITSAGLLLVGSTLTSNNGAIQGFIAHGSTAGESGITSVDTTSMAAGVGGEISFYGKTSGSGYNYLGHIRGIKENGTDTNTACALTFHTRPTLTAPQERVRITSDGLIGVGTATPAAVVHLHLLDNPSVNINSTQHAQNNNIKINFGIGQQASTNGNTGARIQMVIPNAGGAMNGDLRFYTNHGDSLIEKVRITESSVPTLLIGQTTAGADANGWTLRGAINTSSVRFTSTDVRTMFFMSSYHSTGSADTKFAFHTNGTMNATNTTIQAFSSERRTKKNIVALNLEKAWNTLRDTPFYTFNYKNEIEGTRLHHGPIVDECPEDLIVPTEKEDEVGIINTVNTEKLQYRAYSALQQALKKIEVLETKVAALEAA